MEQKALKSDVVAALRQSVATLKRFASNAEEYIDGYERGECGHDFDEHDLISDVASKLMWGLANAGVSVQKAMQALKKSKRFY